MEISIKQSKILKTIAILMMLCLHLFNTLDYKYLFTPLVFVGSKPLIYYISLFCDACVPIFAFVSGYGLFFNFQKEGKQYSVKNRKRLLKLYINYWIILIIFVGILSHILSHPIAPHSWAKFLLNFTALIGSYNGAWWFLLIYILLVLSAPFLFKLVLKYNIVVILLATFVLYVLSFYLRIYRPNIFQNHFLQWLQTNGTLYGCTLLPFLAGAIAQKDQWNTKVSILFKERKYTAIWAVSGIIVLIVIHGLVPNFIIAPFTGIVFVFLFNQIPIHPAIERFLLWLSDHATNMWLIHMFFYMIYFKQFIYSPRYVLPIFLLLVTCCVLSSLVINYINQKTLEVCRIR
ncbi:acyltransferase [Taibaiella sp. KBW10]|uniref:acyltransferase family protein n=1 Tax=Taibaiella sp. KBW10 TaxID=2153357 RepID=UPI000F5A70D6|nr:acyltransferase [Taibaiella sp. KBW10]RQO31928.1 acyltransferase [Taibaiella sp. KBW10]